MLVVVSRLNPEAMLFYKVLVQSFVDKVKLGAAFSQAWVTTMRVEVLSPLSFHGIVH